MREGADVATNLGPALLRVSPGDSVDTLTSEARVRLVDELSRFAA